MCRVSCDADNPQRAMRIHSRTLHDGTSNIANSPRSLKLKRPEMSERKTWFLMELLLVQSAIFWSNCDTCQSHFGFCDSFLLRAANWWLHLRWHAWMWWVTTVISNRSKSFRKNPSKCQKTDRIQFRQSKWVTRPSKNPNSKGKCAGVRT